MTENNATRASHWHPWHVALLVLALYGAFVGVKLQSRDWDITRFIVAGDRFTNAGQLVAPIAILPNSAGYDGQFYYRLGLDPFTSQATAFGITLDNPSTRIQRIAYPFLGWVFSLGHPAALPYVMVGLNLAGLFLIALVATTLARCYGLPLWLGLAPPLYPGFELTLLRDTTEITAVTFGITALFFATRRQYWRALPFAAAAVFSRETTLFYMAGFGLMELVRCLQQRRWSWNLVALLLPALIFFAWQGGIARHWGETSYTGTGQNIGLPFVGLAQFFTSIITGLLHEPWMSYPFKLDVYYGLAAGMCMVALVLAGSQVLRGGAPAGLKASWCLYLALVTVLTTSIWIQPYDFLRAFSDCFTVGALVIMLSGRRWVAAALLVMIVPMWLLTVWFTA